MCHVLSQTQINTILSPNPKKAKTKTKFRTQIILSDGTPHRSRRTKLFAFGIWFLSWLFSDLHSKLSFDLENLCLAQHVTRDLNIFLKMAKIFIYVWLYYIDQKI